MSETNGPTPETVAQRFHETYERLAPSFGYQTREASAKPWNEVPDPNRRLMIAVCAEVMAAHAAELADLREQVRQATEALTELAPASLGVEIERLRAELDAATTGIARAIEALATTGDLLFQNQGTVAHNAAIKQAAQIAREWPPAPAATRDGGGRDGATA